MQGQFETNSNLMAFVDGFCVNGSFKKEQVYSKHFIYEKTDEKFPKFDSDK